MNFISILTQCYNEEENVTSIYEEVKNIFNKLEKYTYEHIFIDNASTDNTVEILKQIVRKDRNVKLIVNARNFGHVKSGTYGLLQTNGDAVIPVVADLQDPPSLIPEFIKKWEEGYKIVIAIKKESEESFVIRSIRKLYYNIINRLADIDLVKNFTGYGLYDKEVIDIIRDIDDPYPYFRGLICDIGFERAEIPYSQPARKKGVTKNNFYTLYDLAMLGIISHSKIPLRLGTMIGFISSVTSMIVALVYFIYKLIFWKSFSLGIAPLVIGFFFFFSILLFFLGIIGEYLGSIHTQVLKRPLVIEKERINF